MAAISPRIAHLMRAGLMVIFSIFRISSLVIFSVCGRVFPMSFSVSMEAEAWLMAQPSPSKVARSILPFLLRSRQM